MLWYLNPLPLPGPTGKHQSLPKPAEGVTSAALLPWRPAPFVPLGKPNPALPARLYRFLYWSRLRPPSSGSCLPGCSCHRSVTPLHAHTRTAERKQAWQWPPLRSCCVRPALPATLLAVPSTVPGRKVADSSEKPVPPNYNFTAVRSGSVLVRGACVASDPIVLLYRCKSDSLKGELPSPPQKVLAEAGYWWRKARTILQSDRIIHSPQHSAVVILSGGTESG